jgi:carboxypeptidase C (cathepsin A)
MNYTEKYIKYKLKYKTLKGGFRNYSQPTKLLPTEEEVLEKMEKMKIQLPINQKVKDTKHVDLVNQITEPKLNNIEEPETQIVNDMLKTCKMNRDEDKKNIVNDMLKSCVINRDADKKEIFNILSHMLLAKRLDNRALSQIIFLLQDSRLSKERYDELSMSIKAVQQKLEEFIAAVKDRNILRQFNSPEKPIETNKDWVDTYMTLIGFTNEFEKITKTVDQELNLNVTPKYKKTVKIMSEKELLDMNNMCDEKGVDNCEQPCHVSKPFFSKHVCKFKKND